MKFALFTAFLLASAPAFAQDADGVEPAMAPPAANQFPTRVERAAMQSAADSRPEFWRGVRAGMSMAEVQRLFPAGAGVKHKGDKVEVDPIDVLGECKGEAEIRFDAGVVDTVVVRGNGSMGGRCSDKVLTGLSSKYGQPLAAEKTGGSILAREGKVYVWTRDGVSLRFKRFSNGVFGGGGLGQSAFELTYSTAAGDIDL